MIPRMFGRSDAEVAPEDALAARPVRLVTAEMAAGEDGATWRLVVPVRPPVWAARFLRLGGSATKTFEFDAVGVRVWNACDGKTAVRDIVGDVAREYGLTHREAEVATRQFLRTLALKGLIGVAPKSAGSEGNP